MKIKSISCTLRTGPFLKVSLLVSVFFCICFCAYTQAIELKPRYDTWIKLDERGGKIKGFLHRVDDTHIQILNKDYESRGIRYMDIPIHEIKYLKLREEGKTGKVTSMLIGAVTGFTIGAALGFISGDDVPPSRHSYSFTRNGVRVNCKQAETVTEAFGCSIGFSFESAFTFTAGEKAIIFGTALSIPGIIIGAIAGTPKITIPLDKQKSKYQKNLLKLKSYTVY